MDSAEEPNRESVVHRAEPFVAENWQPWLEKSKPVRRMNWILTLAIVLGNTVSAVALDYMILFHDVKDEATVLFGGCASVFVTNVIAFGLLYWEFDRGGPFARRLRPKDRPHPDFLFPQMAQPAAQIVTGDPTSSTTFTWV